MKLVFCGTPEFAVPTLRAVLDAGHDVALVLTQPDRPAGRKLDLQPPPVKQFAVERGLRVWQPERLRHNQELQAELQGLEPEAILVVAYGRIIPNWMLQLPRFGNLNLHGSLLPKYRGAAPLQWAVANGETETGVTTMRLDAGLDTGDILLEHRVSVGPEMMARDLFASLAEQGAALMLETLRGLAEGNLPGRPQKHDEATLAPILTRDDGLLELHQRAAVQVYNRWRGFYPWPGAFARFREKRFLVHRMRLLSAGEVVPVPPPGELRLSASGLLAGTADGNAIVLEEVQMEGKPRMAGQAFARDFQLQPGEQLG